MRHRRKAKYFSRKFNARKALLRGLMVSLVENGRIKTTVEKAKELRRHIERAITLGKKNDLATRRLLLSRISNETAVDTILSDISPRMKTRQGGYTRIIKIGRRPGDQAEMAFIEFVDHQWDAKTADTKTAEKAEKTATKKAPAKKAAAKKTAAVVAKKKSAKKIQKKSRSAARA